MSLLWKHTVGLTDRADSKLARSMRCPTRAILTALLFLLIAGTSLLTGCANIKQYSIDSYQGSMPMHDLRYTGIDP